MVSTDSPYQKEEPDYDNENSPENEMHFYLKPLLNWKAGMRSVAKFHDHTIDLKRESLQLDQVWIYW